MSRSRSSMPVVLSWATLCLLSVHPAAGAAGTKAGLLPAPGVRTGPASPGEQLWVKRYNGPFNDIDAAFALEVSPDGSTVFVTGGSRGTDGSFDYATAAYSASTGEELWVKRYEGVGFNDEAEALGVSRDGSKVFVTGFSLGPIGDFATVAYDASTGEQLWVRRYDGGDSDIAYAVGVSLDGSKVFVTGGSTGSTSFGDFATVAYNAATGAELWVRRYNGPGNFDDSPKGLAVSPDGFTLFVTGASTGSNGSFDYATVAYNAATGGQLWVMAYGPGDGDDHATALGVSPDGGAVFVTGDSARTKHSDYATVAYNASTGAELWVRRYNGPEKLNDFAHALAVSPDGFTVFVTGHSRGTTSDDYATVAYSATGTGLWVKRYNGPQNMGNGIDVALAVGVSPDGSTVFVTGYIFGLTLSEDYATLAHNASTGALLWVRRYNGPGNINDAPSALGVTSDGSKMFVTGSSGGSGTGLDYATVAYSIT